MKNQTLSLSQKICLLFLTKKVNGPFSLFYYGGGGGRRLVERPIGYPECPYHAALAGAVSGYLIWGGKHNHDGVGRAVSEQIQLYLLSRILTSLVQLFRERHQYVNFNSENWFSYKAAIIWGAIMYLYETYPHVLQNSLRRSMEEIYRHAILPSSSSS